MMIGPTASPSSDLGGHVLLRLNYTSRTTKSILQRALVLDYALSRRDLRRNQYAVQLIMPYTDGAQQESDVPGWDPLLPLLAVSMITSNLFFCGIFHVFHEHVRCWVCGGGVLPFVLVQRCRLNPSKAQFKFK